MSLEVQGLISFSDDYEDYDYDEEEKLFKKSHKKYLKELEEYKLANYEYNKSNSQLPLPA